MLLSIQDFRALSLNKPDLRAYLLGGIKVDDFEIRRDHDTGRKKKL